MSPERTGGDGYGLSGFTAELDRLVAAGLPENELTERVAGGLTRLLADGFTMPEGVGRPHADHYVMRPLVVSPDGKYSVAAAVWNVGQGTPVHGHETWGVVGICSGVEHETRYTKPDGPDRPLTALEPRDWRPGEVTVCCTTDDDVHSVRCGGDEPCVGIHVYGADIGTLRRRSYDPETGAVNWFVSTWES